MLFSGIPFLYFFLPCVIVLYFAVPKCLKNAVLLFSSLFFYGWGEPKYVILMVISILCGYGFGLLIDKYRGTKWAKPFMIVSVLISLSFLLYFKYADFFIKNFTFGLPVKLLNLALPIGISFYTFQIISYTVDVYRGDVKARKNPITLAAYVAMFPQLIAGPIVRYSDIEEQLDKREHNSGLMAAGAGRFILGLGKKVLIANILGELCADFKASEEISVLYCWLYAIAYALQVYFDFSGYSDMAIGLGKIFGFRFMENFNYPFISRSITEFWRRWHMSLGTWFRDYVYIPMGGNRVKPARWILNIFTVWFLTGFWHGADWNFILWGLFFGVLLAAEKLFLGKYVAKSKVIGHIYTMVIVIISFIIFDNTDIGAAFSYIGGLVGGGNIPLTTAESLYVLKNYGLVLVIGIVGATPLMKKLFSKENKVVNVLEPVFLAGLLLVITAYLVDGSFNPFLYFRF